MAGDGGMGNAAKSSCPDPKPSPQPSTFEAQCAAERVRKSVQQSTCLGGRHGRDTVERGVQGWGCWVRVRRCSRAPRAGARRRASTWCRGPPCAPTSSRPRPGHCASAQRAKASTPAERRRVVWACGTMHGARWRQVTERWCWARHRIGVEEMVRKRATVPRRLAGGIVPRRRQEAHHARTPQPAQPLQLVQRRRELALRVEPRGLWGRQLPREGRSHRASRESS